MIGTLLATAFAGGFQARVAEKCGASLEEGLHAETVALAGRALSVGVR